jgi:hypothetical protein
MRNLGICMALATSQQNQEKQSAAAVKNSELAAKIVKNLEKMKAARDSENGGGGFFKMQSGQKTVLQFTGDFEAVLREFPEKDANGNVIKDENGEPKVTKKIRYEYQVVDLNQQDKGEMTWAVSKNVSKSIDEFLGEGFLTLKVSREGADMGTKYYFVPVTSSNGKGVQ